MNEAHLELLASEDWRAVLRDMAFPFAFGPGSPADLGDDVLEIGPGPGMTTDLLTAELATITAIELDPRLAAALGRRYDQSDAVTVVEGDATAMPFDDDRFSGACCFTMMHHVPDLSMQDRIFAEVGRVLRPGGLLVANDSVASAELEALHVDDVYNPVDPEGLEARVAAAGFVDIEIRSNPFAWVVRARAPQN